MQSKENQILELFFNHPTKEWHFEEILKASHLARSKADKWLKHFIKSNLIKKVKKEGKMPHYISNHQSSEYKNTKKLFALNNLYLSGFLNHLTSLKKVKSVILFGSFTRSDWYKNSDIDLFIYGDTEGLKLAEYELKLKRHIQVFNCHNKKELNRFGDGLIRNIIKGNLLKGDIDFVKVGINA
jgi:predicted nucleotidyltransferase